MWLSRTVLYGVHAALLLGEGTPGHSVACSELAAVGRMPERFLLQILRSMVTRGVLISTRGVNGGYFLARSLQEISVLDVMDAVEGPSEHARSRSPFLSIQSQAILDKAFNDNRDAFRTAYSGIRLSQLVLDPHEQLHAHKYGISN